MTLPINAQSDYFEKLAEEKRANSQFAYLVQSQRRDEIEKMANEYANTYVKLKLRERRIASKILAFENVGVDNRNVRRNEHDNTLDYIKDLEPGTRAAIAVTLRGRAPAQYIHGKRYSLPFAEFDSGPMSIKENELLAFDMPLTQVIEENGTKDVEKAQDLLFFQAAKKIIDDRESAVVGSALVGGAGDITKNGMLDAINLVEGRELLVAAIVMTHTSYNTFLKQTNQVFGDDLAAEIVKNGYVYDRILNKLVYISIKNDVVDEVDPVTGLTTARRVWFFVAPQYLGDFKVLGDTKFYIENRFGKITTQIVEYAALGIANTLGLSLLRHTV